MQRQLVVIALLAAVACFPIRDLGCDCTGDLSPEAAAEFRAAEARSTELAGAWITAHGGTLRVHDDALGVDWIAVEPGTTGLRFGPGTLQDPPFGAYAEVQARREDASSSRPRNIHVGFVVMPTANGMEVVAASLRAVGPDPETGGPTQDRNYHACPVGDRHFDAFAAGESPCHHVPLVPLYKCGCDQPIDYTNPDDCAKYDRKPELKTVCRKDRGEPQPK